MTPDLDPIILAAHRLAVYPDRGLARDRYNDWYGIAWSAHERRWVSGCAHVDAVLREAAVVSRA
jgi:hypothetical protein